LAPSGFDGRAQLAARSWWQSAADADVEVVVADRFVETGVAHTTAVADGDRRFDAFTASREEQSGVGSPALSERVPVGYRSGEAATEFDAD
jgi:hypothetical protein